MNRSRTVLKRREKLSKANNSLVYKEFLKTKGRDGAPLTPYYNPKPKRTALYDHFNYLELQILKFTRKRGKFNWFVLGVCIFAYIVGVGYGWFYNFINMALFWGVMFIGVFEWKPVVELREWLPFACALIVLLSYMVNNQLHILFKTIRDEVEIKKLLERDLYLERRIASTLIGYMRVNIVAAFFVRFLYEHGFIKLSGVQGSTAKTWLRLCVENMLNLPFFPSIMYNLGFETLSIKPIDIYAQITMVTVLLFNWVIAFAAVLYAFQIFSRIKMKTV